ncbi:hypothetical protein GOBAR_AA29951 [Gossypium barbadense]|uniref:Peptidase A1 domain-containing protein n=1 Tax=Gossypium barbadense TaxID=3634 RepID=A0A2P5WI31_GOSBA|nr:hypothetical protein GOBAR_AA29951 [Gossypium barbadense]
MGTTIISPTFLSAYLLLLCLVCCLKEGYGLGRRATAESHHLEHSHTIQVTSLLPSSICSPATKELNKKSSLRVVHKHGPCSQLHRQDKANIPTDAEILRQDEARVKSIHLKLARSSGSSNVDQIDATNLPAKDGSVVGSGNYVVTVGLGTPKKDLTLIFDTGSDITWTQCQPCAGSCYQQLDPVFAPSQSSTYSNISCNSTTCNSLASATGNLLFQ